MQGTEANFDISLYDLEHQSQTAHVNVMNCVILSSDLCESNAVHLKQEESDVDISDNTGENSVDIPAQLNASVFSLTTGKCFKCNICSKSFASKDFITKHLYKHRNVEAFTCDICNNSFPFNSRPYWILTYTNEKPFKVDICSKSFSQKPSLRIHTN